MCPGEILLGDPWRGLGTANTGSGHLVTTSLSVSQHQPDTSTPDWNTEISKLKYKILGTTKNNLHDQGSVRWHTRTLHRSTAAAAPDLKY